MNKFYVYSYNDVNGPFYIGKGTGDRRFDHLKFAKNTKKNTHFLNKIRKLLRENSSINIEILKKN